MPQLPHVPYTLLASPHTSPSLLPKFNLKDDLSTFALIETSEDLTVIQIATRTIVDVLNNEFLSLNLRENWGESRCVINGNQYELLDEQQVWMTERREIFMLGNIVKWIRLRSVCVFLQESRLSYEVSMAFFDLELLFFFVSPATDLNSLFRKEIKPHGYTCLLLLLPPAAAKEVLLAASDADLGNVFIFLSEVASRYRFQLTENDSALARSGPIFIVPSACVNATSERELIYCELNMNNQTLEARIMSMAISGAIQIGRVNEVALMEITLVFTSATPTVISPITISMNNGPQNPHSDNNTSVYLDYFGANLAIADVNKQTVVLPYHSLMMENMSLGVSEFDFDWVAARLDAIGRSKLGVAMLTGAFSGVASGVHSILTALNYSIPQVGSSNTSPILSSQKQFPLFTRVSTSDSYIAVIFGRMLVHYGWKNVCLVYVNETWSEGLYRLIENETRKLSITVRNREELRRIPQGKNSTDVEFTNVFKEILESKARIVILILYGQDLKRSIEALYDLGLRKGDLVFIATEWLEPSLFTIENQAVANKIKELCEGAVMFFPSAFVGSKGSEVQNEYRAAYKHTPPTYACYYYDAVWLLAHALDYLIAIGDHYHSAHVLDLAIRETRFVGCSGVVTIEEGTNDRAPGLYSILNAQAVGDGGVELRDVGTYDPSGVVLFKFATQILWPGNTTQTPTDIRGNADGCPFESKHIVTYNPATILSYTILEGICFVGIAIAAVCWITYWNKKAKLLKVKSEASFEDYFVYVTIAIEAAQYASICPGSSPEVTFQSSSILWFIGGNMHAIMRYAHVEFWAVLLSAICLVALWVFLLTAAKLNSCVGRKCYCEWTESLSEVMLPLLGNLCFVPIISTLLSVFQCPKAVSEVGEDMTVQRAFLQWDCSEFCWQPPHIVYSGISLLCLIVYIPSAIFLRPAWQHIPVALHIHTSPSFLMLKSIYQLILIGLEKTLLEGKAIEHVTFFFAVTIIFAGISLRIKPFGYSRANLWHFVSIMGVAWLTALNIIRTQIEMGTNRTWSVVFAIGLFVICVAGAAIQVAKLPALLYAQKGIHVVELFRFMFSRGRRYFHIFHKTYAPSSESLQGLGSIHRIPVVSGPSPLI